ncbi:MAG: hypothetical protein ACK4FL_02235 [Microgenomates group bacterium]
MSPSSLSFLIFIFIIIKGNIDKASYQKYYHLPSCKQYHQIVIEKDIGEKYFCSKEEAQKAGFKKAAGCP